MDEVLAACAGCEGPLEGARWSTYSFRCECGDMGALCATCVLAGDGAQSCRACNSGEQAHEPAGCVPCEEADDEPPPTTAHVFESFGEFFVHVAVAGNLVEVAGPFHDEADAQLAALRNSDDAGWCAPSWAKRRQRTPLHPQLAG